MPPGDAQRVWVPEMIERLRADWAPAMTWLQLADYLDEMAALRLEIRAERGIKAPLFRCRCCGAESRSEIRQISIRSALFALKNSGAITEAKLAQLDKRWKKYRATHRLDRYGRPAQPKPAATTCSHLRP